MLGGLGEEHARFNKIQITMISSEARNHSNIYYVKSSTQVHPLK